MGKPPAFQHVLGQHCYRFDDLKMLLACASPARSGDELAGIAAQSQQQRVAARYVLADLPLTHFLTDMVIPYESDDVTRLIQDSHDREAFRPIASLTVGGLRDWLLSYQADAQALSQVARGLTPEMVAAVSKLMRNQDLIMVAAKCRVTSAFRSSIGQAGRLASRLQPNHPADEPMGILAAILDGLQFGMGDAVIGINPASDSLNDCIALLELVDDLRQRLEIPTQSCVLSHVTTTIAAIQQGAPVDLVFQSIAGSELANHGFGITLSMLKEAEDAALSLNRGTIGTDVMYFETGQGSALSANAHFGVDQQTMEVRAYGVARAFRPLLVNSVVGFIGPEYLYDSKQILRAGLEDHCCGKLLGLPMGLDVCYTNHAEADQDDMDSLMTLLAVAGVAFLIAVPGGDDIMLGYQSLSFHDVLGLRHLLNLRPAPEFDHWLENMGMLDGARRLAPLPQDGAPMRRLLAAGGIG
jgi:ethanolamine ammonia-lyase large subunit